jgi:tRNA (guanine-N7-)-methyltransferase
MDAAAEDHRDRATTPAGVPGPGRQDRYREPVSFRRRGGRLTERQQRAWDALHATHVVDVPRHATSTSVDPEFRLDTSALFGRDAPLVVEIGSGRGEALVAAAAERPDRDFLGLEVYVPGVAQTLVTMRHQGVSNVRMAVVNAAEALATMLAPGSAHELWTWFPDPWHKKRHHKRRLVTVPFTARVARVLEPGGTWRFATDWDDYADVVADVIETSQHVDGGPVPRYEGRVLTRFETKGIAAGRRIRDLAARPTLAR